MNNISVFWLIVSCCLFFVAGIGHGVLLERFRIKKENTGIAEAIAAGVIAKIEADGDCLLDLDSVKEKINDQLGRD